MFLTLKFSPTAINNIFYKKNIKFLSLYILSMYTEVKLYLTEQVKIKNLTYGKMYIGYFSTSKKNLNPPTLYLSDIS